MKTQNLIKKLWLTTFSLAIVILISAGLFPLNTYPLIALVGLGWLAIGGVITLVCLVWTYRKKWWKEFRLHLTSMVLAVCSLFLGVLEMRATGDIGINALSPSWLYIARVNGLGDSGTSPYQVQLKWTFIPFFSLFSREIFFSDCDNLNIKWKSNKLLSISCTDSTNIQTKLSSSLGVAIEYEIKSRPQLQ